jgi:uncharacterized Zn finger protein
MPRRKERPEWAEDYWYAPSKPIPVAGGLKARSQQGAFTQTWWATAWERALLGFMDANRLSRGKTYARRGQVVELDIRPGQIVARVQGSRPTPYRLRIAIQPLSDADWERAIDALAQQAIYAAQLLNGEMPREIAQVLEAIGVTLFPSGHADVEMTCSCPDWEAPCKHLAAVLLLVGERLDQDPFLLFTLRGRTQEQIVRALRERRARRAELPSAESALAELSAEAESPHSAPQALSPTDTLDRFWQLGAELESLQVHVRPPEVELQVLKVLGEPAFAQDETLQQRLAEVYSTVSKRALEIAYGEPVAADEPREEPAAP